MEIMCRAEGCAKIKKSVVLFRGLWSSEIWEFREICDFVRMVVAALPNLPNSLALQREAFPNLPNPPLLRVTAKR